ncbi:MAG: helix-turn-helix domain-containing protein [Propionibacteriaceae bacterium]|jgi:HTH-type transcriptional regulator/antitoxin HipB|nr:helix-turn-helix domain-containing protein [Propionibacteriaceae bacterium]
MAQYIVTPRQLGAAIRQARLDARLTQQELADRSRVSRRWLGVIELGKAPRAELGHVLAVLASLDLGLQLANKPKLYGQEAIAAAYLEAL